MQHGEEPPGIALCSGHAVRGAPRVTRYTALVESARPREAAVSPETGDPDLDPATGGFTAPSGGGSNVIIDRTQTLPQRTPAVPPDGSQPPWGPPDEG